MQLTDIKINHVHEPLGFMMENTPVIGYKVRGAAGNKQKSVRFAVKNMKRTVYDSGELTDTQPVYPLPVTLLPRTRYEVSLTVTTDESESATTQTWFETGKRDEVWSAEWITHSDDTTVPVLGKRFSIEKKVLSARLYVSACGLYSLSLNREKVGTEYLTPYCNSYRDWMQVITLDATEQLRLGDNLLEATLAGGWYQGRFGLEHRENIYGDTLALLAELHIRYLDGTEQVISSDGSWFSRKSEYVSAEIYNGVVLDFTIDRTTESLVRVLNLDKAKLTDRLSLPVTVKETLPVAKTFITLKGERCLDMGQNIVGWLRIDTTKFPDKDFTIRFFEVPDPDGNVYTDNLRSAQQAFVYKTDGKPRVIEPEFTFYGFRYAYVEGLDELPVDAFTGCVVYSDMARTGQIKTSNPLVNRLFLNALWGQKGNFVDVPTDCPQRDERLGWTGDAQVFCGTASFNMDTAAFFEKYLYDIRKEQQRRGGGVPHFVPSFKANEGNDDLEASSAAWGDAAAVIPWVSYLHTGDKIQLARQYSGMKAWVEYIRQRDSGNFLWDTGFHFGDWLALDTPNPEEPLGVTPNEMVASAYYLYSAELVSKAAGALGLHDDAKEYAELAENIRAAMRQEFVTPSGRIASDTQTANVISLFMGFAADRQKVAAMLNKKILSNKGHLNTGFVGTAYLCRVLSDNGYNDTAYRLLLNREYPGWLYEVEKGATTIWERWNSIKPDGSLGDVGMNSFNHYAYGAVMEWVYRNAAGLQPLPEYAGFQRIRFAPQPNNRLEWLKAAYDSTLGIYRSEWRITEDGLHFTFEIPFGGIAELVLPDAPEEISINGQKTAYTTGMPLQTGVYTVSYQPITPYYIVYGLDSPAQDVLQRKTLTDWLREHVPAYNEIMFFVFLSPAQGTLREFLQRQGITLDSQTEERLTADWAKIRSWE